MVFYVDNFKIAKILANADRTIEMPNGFKMIIKVRNGVPPVVMDEKMRERMKLVMAKRFNGPTKALDLTKFHEDPDLSDCYCGLSRSPIMIAAIQIISENIPDLEALNLSGNKIYTLESAKSMITKLPNLRILYLSNNKVSSASRPQYNEIGVDGQMHSNNNNIHCGFFSPIIDRSNNCIGTTKNVKYHRFGAHRQSNL